MKLTKEEFKRRTGIDLAVELHGEDDAAHKVERFLELVWERVTQDISPHLLEQKLSTRQEAALLTCQIDYARFLLKNGDLYTEASYDAERGISLEPGELEAARMPAHIRTLLRRAGLLTRGLTRTYGFDQGKDWW